MPFRPFDALIALDRKLTPGPIGRLYIAHYENVRQHAASLSTDALITEIARYQKAEPARIAITVLAVVDVVGAAAILGNVYPLETAIAAPPVALGAILIGPHRGTVKLHDREIMEEELDQRRAPDAIG